MKNYILSVCLTIIICIITNLMVPSEKYSGIMKIVCGLFVVHTLINPVKNILNTKPLLNLPDLHIHNDEFEKRAGDAKQNFDVLMEQSAQNIINNDLSRELKKRWNNSITAYFDGKVVRVQNADAVDYENIENFIKKVYGLRTLFG